MAWVLRSPQIHSIFSHLGFVRAGRYHVDDNCDAALEIILHNILTEDKNLRIYRRSISFGKNIQKDLLPLLIHAKEDKTIQLLVRILANLSIPIECLLSVQVTLQTYFGRHAVFEINQLLASIKAIFTSLRATKVLIDFLKKNVNPDQPKVSPEQYTNISNSLLLLRNILHTTEDVGSPISGNNGSDHAEQNLILWNMFSQSVDKVLIKLMTIPEATNWGLTMVQIIALMYRDQHVVTLHKLLNMWLESFTSESSEDNESNTSLKDRGNDNSSPMLTSDPTSDLSDTVDSKKGNYESNSETNGWGTSKNNTMKTENQQFQPQLPDENDMRDQDATTGDEFMKFDNEEKVTPEVLPTQTSHNQQPAKAEKKEKRIPILEMENQESISTSSIDDEIPLKKPVHNKPHNAKQRVNTKARMGVTLQERKRKKITKRGKANIINVQGLAHPAPTDDDISYILKEFTIDFLLKGYNSLVVTLHSQILTNVLLETDTSHFFWLVTYFLKFATQIKLDLNEISGVISFDMVSYLTAEGVNICEQFELAVNKLDINNLEPISWRLRLVIAAIREIVQTIEEYIKLTHICTVDKDALITLQNKMCETDELKSLLVLLLRHYNPKYHSKQYLQDLVVTNHILLRFLDSAMRNRDTGSTDVVRHMKQFATPEIMYKYGLLLEDYAVNGEFINDCVFTIMHHVGGKLNCLNSLHQPKILKTFTSIWKSEFEICDDWSDLLQYVINTFVKKPHPLFTTDNFTMDTQTFDEKKALTEQQALVASAKKGLQPAAEGGKKKSVHSSASQSSLGRWTKNELSASNCSYLQYKTHPDVVSEKLKCLKENDTDTSRNSVIRELHKQNVINKEEYKKLATSEIDTNKGAKMNKEIRDVEIGKLCEQLRQDGKTKCFDWVQQVLLETCHAKLQIEKRHHSQCGTTTDPTGIHHFKFFNQGLNSPVMSPVSYHALLLNKSVPLVAWKNEQAAMCKDLKFLQLLHKLGFQMPVDTGKVFIRVPHVWSADVLYQVAGRVAVIDTTKLKFSITDISSSGSKNAMTQCSSPLSALTKDKDVTSTVAAPENFYQIHKQKHDAAVMNLMPKPGSSLNTDVQNEIKRCWLAVVQQSQQLKLTCDVGSVLEDEEEPTKSKAPAVAVQQAAVQLAAVQQTAVHQAAVQQAAVQRAVVQQAAVQQAVVQQAVVQQTAVQQAAVHQAAVKQAAVQQAAVQLAAVQQAAVQQAAVQQAAVQLAAVQQAAVQQAAVQLAAVQQAAVQQAAVQQAAVQLAAVQQAAVQQAAVQLAAVQQAAVQLAAVQQAAVQQVAAPVLPAAAAPVRPETMPPDDDIAQLAKLENNNSDSKTESVASDLTRMYVSEEELKIALRASLTATANGIDDGVASRAGGPLRRRATRSQRSNFLKKT